MGVRSLINFMKSKELFSSFFFAGKKGESSGGKFMEVGIISVKVIHFAFFSCVDLFC